MAPAEVGRDSDFSSKYRNAQKYFSAAAAAEISPREICLDASLGKRKMKKGKDKKSAPPLSPPGNVHPCRGAPTPRSTDGSAARPPLPLVYIYYIVQTGFQPAAAPAASPSADSIVFGEIVPRRSNSRPRSALGGSGSGAGGRPPAAGSPRARRRIRLPPPPCLYILYSANGIPARRGSCRLPVRRFDRFRRDRASTEQ